jgi:hypothetical protein
MRKVVPAALGLLFFGVIGLGLWDLFRDASVVVWFIMLPLIFAGLFNTVGALKQGRRS